MFAGLGIDALEQALTSLGSTPYFNQVAEEYASRYGAQTPGGYALRVRQQRVLELLDRRGGKALDVGCGPGRMAPDLLSMGYEFWGVDAAPAMIEQCVRHLGTTPRAHFSVGDAQSLAFDDGFFDCVICMGVIDRIENWQPALAEMIRVLKADGALVVSFPNLVGPYAWWKNFVFYPVVAWLRPLYCGLMRRQQPPSLYGHAAPRNHVSLLASFAKLQTAHGATTFMTKLGVQVMNVEYYNFTLLLPPLDELLPGWSLRLSESLERLRFGRLRWLGAGFIVKARKIA